MRLGSLFCYSLIAMLLGELRAQKEVLDLLDEHCIRCHNPEKIKGELDLESIYEEKMSDHPEIWEKVIKRLEARDMPPHKSRKRPEEAQYQETAQSLIEILDASAKVDPQPGREATFRRLTRREYQNAVRDQGHSLGQGRITRQRDRIHQVHRQPCRRIGRKRLRLARDRRVWSADGSRGGSLT